MKKITILLAALMAASAGLQAQTKLTLEDCRDLALNGNKQAQIDKELTESASDLRKAALANFFPKVSANGLYMWNEKNISILPNNLSTNIGSFDAAAGTFTYSPESLLPEVLPLTSEIMGQVLGEEYQTLHNRATFDIHNVFVGQVGVIQPIYLGGRIHNAYSLTKGAEKIAQLKAGKNTADLITNVNEAYWRVVSVQEKLKLATQYVDLLKQLETNVEAAIEEGVATKSDLLKVRLKLSEGEMKKAQAEDGLALSKMALCQICDLELTEDIVLDATHLEDYSMMGDTAAVASEAVHQRSEIQLLEEAEKMSRSMVRLSSASLQPNILASANYLISNPNMQDGFKNDFRGGFNVSVVVNIPIAHADAILRYKSAKHAANVAKLKLEESIEKVNLQITQSIQKVKQSNKKLQSAQANIEQADEVLRMAQEAYNEGVATATDLLMAQTGWQQAYSEKIDAAIELRMNELTLEKHLGKLSQQAEEEKENKK